MYKDIAEFLKESPKWIESWLNTPVKAKYIQSPLMIPLIFLTIFLLDIVNFGIENLILHYMTFIESKSH